MSSTTDRTFAEVAPRFAAWQRSQNLHPIERAWRRIGWQIKYVTGTDDACAVVTTDCAVAILPA